MMQPRLPFTVAARELVHLEHRVFQVSELFSTDQLQARWLELGSEKGEKNDEKRAAN